MPNCSWRDQSHTWIGTTDEGKSKEKNITCYVNDNRDIFISVCCQNIGKGCKWLLGKTDGISIVNMLQDKITIRQLLLEHSSGKISVDYVENTGYAAAYNNSDWDVNSSYLPKEDSYMYAEDAVKGKGRGESPALCGQSAVWIPLILLSYQYL